MAAVTGSMLDSSPVPAMLEDWEHSLTATPHTMGWNARRRGRNPAPCAGLVQPTGPCEATSCSRRVETRGVPSMDEAAVPHRDELRVVEDHHQTEHKLDLI